MKTVISSEGQIVVPAAIRQQDDILPGQEFEIERLKRGDISCDAPGGEMKVWCGSCSTVRSRVGSKRRVETKPPTTFCRRKCDEFGLMVATPNVGDFQKAGVPVLNPFA